MVLVWIFVKELLKAMEVTLSLSLNLDREAFSLWNLFWKDYSLFCWLKIAGEFYKTLTIHRPISKISGSTATCGATSTWSARTTQYSYSSVTDKIAAICTEINKNLNSAPESCFNPDYSSARLIWRTKLLTSMQLVDAVEIRAIVMKDFKFYSSQTFKDRNRLPHRISTPNQFFTSFRRAQTIEVLKWSYFWIIPNCQIINFYNFPATSIRLHNFS